MRNKFSCLNSSFDFSLGGTWLEEIYQFRLIIVQKFVLVLILLLLTHLNFILFRNINITIHHPHLIHNNVHSMVTKKLIKTNLIFAVYQLFPIPKMILDQNFFVKHVKHKHTIYALTHIIVCLLISNVFFEI